MDTMTTKERILESALFLFAEKGYEGVGVDQIAEQAGLRGPSLYNHFKGKEDIFNSLVDTMTEYYEKNFVSSKEMEKVMPSSLQELVTMSMQKIAFTVHDTKIQAFRRMLAMEQYRNDTMRAMTTQYHLSILLDLYTGIMKALIDQKVLKKLDPRLLAFEFTMPVSMMIHWIDREPDKEHEAMKWIEEHMKHFAQEYAFES